MTTKTLLDVLNFQRQYLSMLIDDVPDARMTEQPGGVKNHPAWHLGHLAYAMDGMVAGMGGEKKLDEAWSTKYGMGSTPVADRGAYPSKAELLRVFDERRSALASRVGGASEGDLKGDNPSDMLRPMLPTRAHMLLFFLHTHEGTHLGQIACWRKAAGMEEALAKFGR
ncbi:MAG: DinB family protein [Phycisphaerales bacterium]|nr:DinB family protein [Phycisphaerales bacterium]